MSSIYTTYVIIIPSKCETQGNRKHKREKRGKVFFLFLLFFIPFLKI